MWPFGRVIAVGVVERQKVSRVEMSGVRDGR